MATNPMQRKARNSFLLGMLITLVIAGAIIALLFIQLKNYKEKEQEEKANSVKVWVLGQDVISGQVITTDMLTQQVVNKNYVPTNAIGNITVLDNYALEDKEGNEVITEYKNTQAPSYIFNDGIEPITFFEFKKNGALREMQIPNLKYYCTFVYNTIAVYDELFSKLYSEPEYDKYVCNSNSYILFNELFHIYKLYDGSEEIIESGIFAVKNNKTTGQLAHEENNVRYLKKQGAKLHSVKVDI